MAKQFSHVITFGNHLVKSSVPTLYKRVVSPTYSKIYTAIETGSSNFSRVFIPNEDVNIYTIKQWNSYPDAGKIAIFKFVGEPMPLKCVLGGSDSTDTVTSVTIGDYSAYQHYFVTTKTVTLSKGETYYINIYPYALWWSETTPFYFANGVDGSTYDVGKVSQDDGGNLGSAWLSSSIGDITAVFHQSTDTLPQAAMEINGTNIYELEA